jgi:hypothetical protein
VAVNDRQLLALTKAGADRLALLAQVLDTVGPDGLTVIARMRDAQGGLRARDYEAAGGNGRRDVTPGGAIRPDRALADERELVTGIETAIRAINRTWSIVANYPPAHRATAAERAALGLGDGPWCASCARVNGSDGAPRCEPIHPNLTGPTDVEGRLAEPLVLCTWCYRCVRDWGRVPTMSEVDRHHRGARVRWPDDVPRPEQTRRSNPCP